MLDLSINDEINRRIVRCIEFSLEMWESSELKAIT
jgi:hypothetical protein